MWLVKVGKRLSKTTSGRLLVDLFCYQLISTTKKKTSSTHSPPQGGGLHSHGSSSTSGNVFMAFQSVIRNTYKESPRSAGSGDRGGLKWFKGRFASKRSSLTGAVAQLPGFHAIVGVLMFTVTLQYRLWLCGSCSWKCLSVSMFFVQMEMRILKRF